MATQPLADTQRVALRPGENRRKRCPANVPSTAKAPNVAEVALRVGLQLSHQCNTTLPAHQCDIAQSGIM